jgi:hypothetical protein
MNDMTGPSAAVAPKRAFGRSLGDFRIDGATTPNELLPAEDKLLMAVARGEICSVADLDWKKSEDLEKLKSDERWRIRADFLRFLALGGDESAPVHEKGVQLVRAYIDGALDIEGCGPVVSIYIGRSYFAGSLRLVDAHLRGLLLDGCRTAHIWGDRSRVDGPVHLVGGFVAEGEASSAAARSVAILVAKAA